MSTNNTNAAPSKADAYDPFGAWDVGATSYQAASAASASYQAASNNGMARYQAASTGMASNKAAGYGSSGFQAPDASVPFSDPVYSSVDYSAKKSRKGSVEKPPPYTAGEL